MRHSGLTSILFEFFESFDTLNNSLGVSYNVDILESENGYSKMLLQEQSSLFVIDTLFIVEMNATIQLYGKLEFGAIEI